MLSPNRDGAAVHRSQVESLVVFTRKNPLAEQTRVLNQAFR